MNTKQFWFHQNQKNTFDEKQLRILIGFLALALPIVVSVGYILFCNENVLLDSISDYYHSEMRNYFVGTLCGVGVVFLCYKGPDRIDRVLADIAAVCAFIVAFFPTTAEFCQENCLFGDEAFQVIGIIHLSAAAILFLNLASFCLFLFTLSDKPKEEFDKPKIMRNKIYRFCGWTILISMAILALSFFVPLLEDLREHHKLVYILEFVMLWMFGISWLTKGEIIFRDKK
jgi:hypothetical protein